MSDITSIADECFMSNDAQVISYKGAQYYRACDAFVTYIADGGASHCVKRVGHPGTRHEDYEGRTRDDTEFDKLSNYLYSNFPWEGATYEALADALATKLINEGWSKS